MITVNRGYFATRGATLPLYWKHDLYAFSTKYTHKTQGFQLKSIVLKGGQVHFGSFREKLQNRILFIIAGNGLQ